MPTFGTVYYLCWKCVQWNCSAGRWNYDNNMKWQVHMIIFVPTINESWKLIHLIKSTRLTYGYCLRAYLWLLSAKNSLRGMKTTFVLFSIPLGIIFNMFEEMHIIAFSAWHHCSFHKKQIWYHPLIIKFHIKYSIIIRSEMLIILRIILSKATADFHLTDEKNWWLIWWNTMFVEYYQYFTLSFNENSW